MLQQYNDGSPKKPRVLILAPTGVAGINLNGTTVYSALGLPCRGKLFPSDSNTLASLRNKYPEVEVIIVGFQIVRLWHLEIAAFLKQVAYQKL